MSIDWLLTQLADSFSGSLRVAEPMSKHTTWRIGGPADLLAIPANERDLLSLFSYCQEIGLPWQIIGHGSNLLVKDGGIRGVAVSYTHLHTPDGLDNLLSTAREITKGRLITVFGCGGDRDRTKRPIMGAISAQYSDFSFITSDNPRTEDPLFIIEEVEAGLKEVSTKYAVVPDRREAILQAIRLAKTGDIVVIAGKGHENYQLIQNQVLPFDDRKVAREILQQLK